MSLSPDVDLEDIIQRPDKTTAADISSICQAAGLQAVRRNRYVILQADFGSSALSCAAPLDARAEEAYKQVVKKTDETHEFCASDAASSPLTRAQTARSSSRHPVHLV